MTQIIRLQHAAVTVPANRLEDAQKWLAAEMKQWETITNAVKIDITQ